jgi:hypothetical protein
MQAIETTINDIEAYKRYKHHRKWFNKLWFAEAMGYECGPASIPPKKSDWYIVRPIMNLSGMSLNAEKKWIGSYDLTKVNPGFFWCEWFEGEQYSVTYEYKEKFEPISCWKAERDVNNLTKFKKWIRADYYPQLPTFFNELSDISKINVEFIDDKPIEVHLRTSPDPDYDELIPVWADNTYIVDIYTKIGYDYINLFDDAEGFLKIPRLGFLVKNKE